MSWFRHRPRAKEPPTHIKPYRSSAIVEKFKQTQQTTTQQNSLTTDKNKKEQN